MVRDTAHSPHGMRAHSCVYAFGTTSKLGRSRMNRLREQMVAQHIDFTAVDAVPAPANFSVPCLAHVGYQSMWLTMLRIWKTALASCQRDWAIVLESDAILPHHFLTQLDGLVGSQNQTVWLDERADTGPGLNSCCTVGMAYSTDALPSLIRHFSPDNRDAYWQQYATATKLVVDHPVCLTDNYLANLVAYLRMPAFRLGIVEHPLSSATESEIRNTMVRPWWSYGMNDFARIWHHKLAPWFSPAARVPSSVNRSAIHRPTRVGFAWVGSESEAVLSRRLDVLR